jgi:hypothetical protein
MLAYPAIDIRGGRCVRLSQGRDDARTDYYHDPVEPAMQFAQAGAAWIHVVDLDGAFGGAPLNLPTLSRIAALGPKMLELARTRTAGTHPYLVTPELTAKAREGIGADEAPTKRDVHMNPEEAIDAFLQLKARTLVPMHYGTFRLSYEPLHEPPERLIRHGADKQVIDRIRILNEGEPTIF